MALYKSVGINNRVLNNFVKELRDRGIWAERHSYSIRLMYKETIVASLHLYPGFNKAILKLYGGDIIDEYVENNVKIAMLKFLPTFHLDIVKLEFKPLA
ncbi:MAG: hypothetical protein QXP02_01795 [Desulfurococcaceae archaeon]